MFFHFLSKLVSLMSRAESRVMHIEVCNILYFDEFLAQFRLQTFMPRFCHWTRLAISDGFILCTLLFDACETDVQTPAFCASVWDGRRYSSTTVRVWYSEQRHEYSKNGCMREHSAFCRAMLCVTAAIAVVRYLAGLMAGWVSVCHVRVLC